MPKGKKKSKTKTNRQVSTSRPSGDLESLALGSHETLYPQTYAPEVLAAFPNKNPSAEAWTSFICTEFTSLCPKTHQPDFARIYINYIADKLMVESKSMKLYLFSFRNHGDFHEDCIQTICDDLTALLKPKFIEVLGEFTPRGGISIYPYASHSNNQKKLKNLREKRLAEYAPGKYTIPLKRIY